MAILGNPKFLAAQAYFEAACHASRTHSNLAADALATHGAHGAQISGCVRDHFPAPVKDQLRYWAHEVTRLCELARANRPRCVRASTMRRLGQEVATRDGAGFYGPQRA